MSDSTAHEVKLLKAVAASTRDKFICMVAHLNKRQWAQAARMRELAEADTGLAPDDLLPLIIGWTCVPGSFFVLVGMAQSRCAKWGKDPKTFGLCGGERAFSPESQRAASRATLAHLAMLRQKEDAACHDMALDAYVEGLLEERQRES